MKNGIYKEEFRKLGICEVHYKDGEIFFALSPRKNKRWYKDGLLHREDGPAIEWYDGQKSWYMNGCLHREDGPAIEYPDGAKSWYLNGIPINVISQKEFERYLIRQTFK